MKKLGSRYFGLLGQMPYELPTHHANLYSLMITCSDYVVHWTVKFEIQEKKYHKFVIIDTR